MSCTFTVLDADGNAFVTPVDILDADGNSFTVGIAALDADGNSFDVGICVGAVVTTDTTKADAGGGRKKKQNLPYYEGKTYGDSRLDVEKIIEKAKRSEKPVVQETRTEAKVEQPKKELGELLAKAELPSIEKAKIEEVYDMEAEEMVILLLLG